MMGVAQTFAKRSTCSRRDVGCVLVDAQGRILSTGHNGTPKGEPHCIDKPCAGACMPSGTGLDDCEAVHAEINALLQCKDVDKIESAYVTTEPCKRCTGALANTSCQNIYYVEPYANSGRERWRNRGEWTRINPED